MNSEYATFKSEILAVVDRGQHFRRAGDGTNFLARPQFDRAGDGTNFLARPQFAGAGDF